MVLKKGRFVLACNFSRRKNKDKQQHIQTLESLLSEMSERYFGSRYVVSSKKSLFKKNNSDKQLGGKTITSHSVFVKFPVFETISRKNYSAYQSHVF